MSIEHQLARLTPQSPPIIMLPGGGIPEVTKEMIAQAAAQMNDDLAYHLVMGKYTDSMFSKNTSLYLVGKESKRIWRKHKRGRVKKKDSFDLLTILAHAFYFHNPEGNRRTAVQKAHFCRLSEASWHAKWGVHYHDLMVCMGARESVLMGFIKKNIWCG